MFGSLERGLDKVITMLTPSKRRALRDGPRKIKVCRSHTPCHLFLCRTRVLHTSHHFCVCLLPLGAIQRYSDQSDQPRPGPQPDPLHPPGEKRRFHTERVKRLTISPSLIRRPVFDPLLMCLRLLLRPSFRYTLKCRTSGDFGKVTMAFELEVCLLQRPEVVGVRRQRLKGDAWVYKHLVEDILSTSRI